MHSNWIVTTAFTSNSTAFLPESLYGQVFSAVPFYTATVANAEAPQDVLFSIVAGNTTQFLIEPVTGVLVSRHPLDYEVDTWAFVFELTLQATVHTVFPESVVMFNVTVSLVAQ